MWTQVGRAKKRTSMCRLAWRRPVATRSHLGPHVAFSWISAIILFNETKYKKLSLAYYV
jgi:hypothetical protein